MSLDPADAAELATVTRVLAQQLATLAVHVDMSNDIVRSMSDLMVRMAPIVRELTEEEQT